MCRAQHRVEALCPVVGLEGKLRPVGQHTVHCEADAMEVIARRMERDEVQGICLAYDSLTRGNLGRSGEINLLLQAALSPDPVQG